PMHAFMWVAAGRESRGTVIIPPQKNGGDSYESLITPLVSSGIHVMKIHPRGMWDSVPALNSPMKTVDDIHAAVEWLRSNDGEHTAYALKEREFRVDPERIGIVGKSGGGGSSGLVAAAENPHLNSVVALAPANVEPLRRMPDMINHGIGGEFEKATLAWFEKNRVLTAGRVDHAFAMGAMTPADFDRVSIIKRAVDLVDKNVLLVGGSADAAHTAGTHNPFVEAMRAAGAQNFTDVLLQADTYFLTARIALARLVIAWLRKQGF
ncbi:MAG: CocE/NonD family hydrolase, partial [Acidimicrobiia bacterium]